MPDFYGKPVETRRNIVVFSDTEALCRTAADQFVRLARAAILSRGRFMVALSGGNTPRRLYQILGAPPFRARIDWSRVEVFWADERAVPPVALFESRGSLARGLQ